MIDLLTIKIILGIFVITFYSRKLYRARLEKNINDLIYFGVMYIVLMIIIMATKI